MAWVAVEARVHPRPVALNPALPQLPHALGTAIRKKKKWRGGQPLDTIALCGIHSQLTLLGSMDLSCCSIRLFILYMIL